MTNPKLEEARARELAVKASVAPQTIRKAYAGLPVKGMAGHRAVATLKAEGLISHDAKAPRWEPPNKP